MAAEPRVLTREEKSAYRQNTIFNVMLGLIFVGFLFFAGPFLIEKARIQLGLATAPVVPLPTAVVRPQPVATPLSPAQLQDPVLNGGNVAPAGCQFPISQGQCANGGAPKEEDTEGVKESPRGASVEERAVPPVPALIVLPTVAPPTDGSPPSPAKGQCLHGQVFTNHGCKNPDRIKP